VLIYKFLNSFSEEEEIEISQQDMLLEDMNNNQNDSQDIIKSQNKQMYQTFSEGSSEITEEKCQSVFVTLIGMIIHSITDGISFGCVSFASHNKPGKNFELIIFLAMILHKIPASVGLSSFMISQKTKTETLIRYLLAFTSSSPLSALLTYYILYEIKNRLNESDDMMTIVGIFLFISAGTFIYVALMHILPEVLENINKKKNTIKGNFINKQTQIGLMILGCCTPFLVHLLE